MSLVLTPCRKDFLYAALIYSNEPPVPNAFLIEYDLHGPVENVKNLFWASRLLFPSVFSVSCVPSPVPRPLCKPIVVLLRFARYKSSQVRVFRSRVI